MSDQPSFLRLRPRPPATLLRPVLKLDAVVTGLNGFLYVVAAEPLDDLLGLSATLLRPTGAFLVVFAAAVWFLATRPALSRPAVLAVAIANGLWAIDSLVFVALGWLSPTLAGSAWVIVQALVVAVFAALQALARPSTPRNDKVTT